MSTLAHEILRRYGSLQRQITDTIGEADLFPKLGDVDALDIASMVVAMFSRQYPKGYRPTIEMMVRLKGVTVTAQQMDELYPHVESFLDWLIDETRKRK